MGIIMDSNIILKCENIKKTFINSENDKIEVLKDASLELIRGKIHILIGASGAGKSTLLHILGGLEKPDSGKILFNSNDISQFSNTQLDSFRNESLGFVFQYHHLIPEMNTVENTALPMMIKGLSQKKSTSRAKELLTQFNLGHRFNNKPAELSGGEQQRTAIARAIINDPELIFADEPTGNLDSVNSKNINDLFLELRDKYNKTFLIATHNPELVKIGDIVFEIKDGQL